jgi:TolB-like protein
MPSVRRLTAILAADVAGYSRLMGVDEEGTHDRLQAHQRELINPKIGEHRGRIVKNTGDGLLAEFSSVVDAVRCAIEVQRGMDEREPEVPEERRIRFRIGINIGDVIVEQHDIFGHGVNVAARLEALAEPGWICVSRVVRDQLRDKVDFAFEDLGEQRIKNIPRPVRVFRVALDGTARVAPAPALPNRPSIAVLPFQNLSNDPEQEYFADGIVEEITMALSRIRQLFVIARNSSFTYKGHAVDVKQVGRELGVRYVLEGSVRKSANRARISAQLIDASTGAHLSAERIEGELADIFDLQDEITTSVVGAIAPQLARAEFERAKRKPTESLDAYDYYLRGWANADRVTREATSDALRLLYKAIDLDPDLALAHGRAALCYMWRSTNGWMTDRAQETAEAARLARRAAELDQDDALALSWAGMTLTHFVIDFDYGATLLERALALNPNLMQAWFGIGWVRNWSGQPEAAIEAFARAMRLSPLDPFSFGMQHGMAFAYFLSAHYDEAVLWEEKALRAYQNNQGALRILAASHAFAGRVGEARKAMTRLRELDPTLCVSNLKIPLRRPGDFARFAEGLRKAGLPEE